MELFDTVVLFCNVFSVVLGNNYIENTFEIKGQPAIALEHLVMDSETKNLFAGAVNRIYQFDKNLNVMKEVITGPKLDNPNCSERTYSNTCSEIEVLTNISNKVLLIDDKFLIACSSLYQGICYRHNLSNIADNWEEETTFKAIVANTAEASTFAFIAPGAAQDETANYTKAMYVGVQFTQTGRKSVRDRVPAFAARKLTKDFELVHPDQITLFKTEIKFRDDYRETFPVRYIYGFGSENFSYMITVQKQANDLDSYITKIFRVCQKDKYFYSYAEIPLQCQHSGALYNIAQAAFLGKVGARLAKALEIPVHEDVLYVSFSIPKPKTAEPTTDSALCVYPMRNIRSTFTKNIIDCFKGNGNVGPAHITRTAVCKYTPALIIDDDYCGNHGEVNYPIDGQTAATANAAVTFNSTVTALTVHCVDDYTVAIAGTADGHIIKVALEPLIFGEIFEDITLVPGSRIKPDIFTDNEGVYLYTMTNTKLLKVKLYICSQFTSCSACLGAKNPYCGWCSLENKCSLHWECHEHEKKYRWLAYNDRTCTMITSVTPDKMPKEHMKSTQLQLNISNQPSFTGLYQCVFTYSKNIEIVTTNSTMTQPNSGIVMCHTPETNMLPPIPTAEDHIIMNLSIVIGGREFVSTQFTIFDCSVHTSCTRCTLSMYPCTWCIQNHKCTHNAEQFCPTNDLVEDQKSLSAASVGPGDCPRIEPRDGNPNILVPSGIRKKVTVMAYNMLAFMLENVRCFFRIGQGREVSSKWMETASRETFRKTFVIECDEVDFTYSEKTDRINVGFDVSWGGQLSRKIDNSVEVQVIMYKCSQMAETCGECITKGAEYKCGWCVDTCTINTQCQSINQWLPSSSTCPNVEITSIEPIAGPKSGGTKLIIHGKNLGTKSQDIDGGITIDRITCNPIMEETKLPLKIVCATGSSGKAMVSPVNVIIGSLYRAQSGQNFTYVEPIINGISPLKGPLSGGTKITITGHSLDAGTNLSVDIGRYSCVISQRSPENIICTTSNASTNGTENIIAWMDKHNISTSSVNFTYINNPTIFNVVPLRGIVSGGITISINGTDLEYIQVAKMIFWVDTGTRKRGTHQYVGSCLIPKNETLLICFSPVISNTTVTKSDIDGVKFSYGIKLDNLFIDRTAEKNEYFTVYPDPIFEEFSTEKMEKLYQSKTDNYLTINGHNMNVGFNTSDVIVRIGTSYCNVTSIDKHGNQLTCKPPKQQPPSAQGHTYPEVIVQVGRNFTKKIGFLKYDKTELLPLPVIIGLGVGGSLLILIVIFFIVLWCIKTRENTSMRKKWQIQMDNLEVKVAKECKEAFAELQTDMNELTNDSLGQVVIPFWDYRTYCMRVLFPLDDDQHAVIRELDVDPNKRDHIKYGLKLFSQLIGNRTFLLTFVRTLEANKKFTMRDKVNVASLISVALQTKMEYATDILKTLLAELIEKSVEGKNHPKLLLRRTESVAEKMLTNWFTFLLYKFLKECAGEPLFMLYQAIKQQTSKGPVDAVTSEARYSLSEDKLIRQQVDYKPMTIYVQDMEQYAQQSHPVKVLDCDTISQVKEKILDAIYKNAPFSSRPTKQSVDLVLFAQNPVSGWERNKTQKMTLADLDNTTKSEGDFKRYNTLAHYQVSDGAFMALLPKQTPSVYDLSITSISSKSFDYKRLVNSKDDYAVLYTGRSPSLNRMASPGNTQVDVEHSGTGTRFYHLVKQHDQESNKEGDRSSKMVSEIYLTRLLATKGTLQQFVDDLFERIFSTCHRGTSLPLAIKYMFDFLDDQALLHNIQDQDVVHTWKSNSLPLRFWVNVIKNPNFVFDIYKSNIVDSCLSVVAQNFMDSCSMSEQKLSKDSPSSKLLYAKDIPSYKKWVDRYYQDIKIMPAISDQDMTAMMTEESRNHQDEFNMDASLFELYKYVQQYREDIKDALDEDEFARKNRLNIKLEQVISAMTGDEVSC